MTVKKANITELKKVIKTAYKTRLVPQIEEAEKCFKHEFKGEAFLMLAGVLEFQMVLLWGIFLISSVGKKFNPHYDTLGFNTYAEILWQIGYISSPQRSDLIAFQKGRNTIVHYASKHLQTKEHPSDKILEDQFKKGLKISNELTNILTEKVEELIEFYNR